MKEITGDPGLVLSIVAIGFAISSMIELIARLIRQRFFTAKYVPPNETPEFQQQEREIAEWQAKRDEVSAKVHADIATIVMLLEDQAKEIERLEAALAKYEAGDQT